jgi:hypothetical protein
LGKKWPISLKQWIKSVKRGGEGGTPALDIVIYTTTLKKMQGLIVNKTSIFIELMFYLFYLPGGKQSGAVKTAHCKGKNDDRDNPEEQTDQQSHSDGKV